MPKEIAMRRAALFVAAALTAAIFAGSASAALKLVRVASGFSALTYATAAPGNRGDVFVVSQAGSVTRLSGGERRTFLDIDGRVSNGGGEEGLLSIAFHPRYETNRKLYVFYVNNQSDLRIVQFRANAAGSKVSNRSAKTLVRISHPDRSNHNGGQLQFGLNGLLYASVGDGGTGGHRAQQRGTKLGKLLQLNVDKRNAKVKTVAFGLRNPWRFSVDRKTGRLFIADVGQGLWEEVDVFRPGNGWLENYGWNRYEGDHLFEPGNTLGPGRYVRPIHEYRHDAGRCSITGGFTVRGGAPGSGRYFYGDYCTGEVWSFRYEKARKSGFRKEPFTVSSLTSFGLDGRGRLLVVSQGGTIYRVARR